MRALIALLLMCGVAQAADSDILKPVSTEQVSYSDTTSGTSSAEIGDYVEYVRLICTADCYVNIQKTPVVAGTTGIFLPADTVNVFRVSPGVKVGVTGDATGVLSITVMSK